MATQLQAGPDKQRQASLVAVLKRELALPGKFAAAVVIKTAARSISMARLLIVMASLTNGNNRRVHGYAGSGQPVTVVFAMTLNCDMNNSWGSCLMLATR